MRRQFTRTLAEAINTQVIRCSVERDTHNSKTS